jgi:GT2 family glycosyltransferase
VFYKNVNIKNIMQEKILVSIIILNFNGLNDTRKCLKSLLKTKYRNYEILVIDNGSDINEATKIEKLFKSKKIKVFRLENNFGFTGGNNWAIKEATGKYIALLNNDTVVEPNWLEPLVSELEKNKKTAVVQPKIKLMKKRSFFDYAGAADGFIDKYGYPFTRGRIFETLEKDVGQYDKKCKIFWASGAACLIRKSVIKRVGGLFSENLYNYMEEIDFCWRVWNKGYKVYFVPGSVVYHKVAGTSKSNLFKKRFWEHRNNLFILARNLDRSKLLFILPVRFFLELVSYLNYIFRKQYKNTLSLFLAHLDFSLKFLKTRYKRNRLPNKDDLPIYHGSIVFDYFIKKIRHFRYLNWSPKGNVAFLIFNTKPSGGLKLILNQVEELHHKGYGVKIYTLFGNNVDWFSKKIKINNLLNYYLDVKPQSLIFTFWPLAYLHKFFESTQKYYLVMDSEHFYPYKLLRFLVRKSFSFDLIKITISNFLKEEITRVDTKNKISIIGSKTVDFSKFYFKRKLNFFDNKRINILSVVSNYEYYKGVDILADAIKHLKKSRYNYKFTLVSREKYRYDKVFDEFISNPTDNKLIRVYKKSDILLATSRAEGLFLPGLEAMASGCIVISTNSQGLLDYAKHNYNSILVEKSEDLWKKSIIDKTIGDSVLCNKLVKNGYRTVKSYSFFSQSRGLVDVLDF